MKSCPIRKGQKLMVPKSMLFWSIDRPTWWTPVVGIGMVAACAGGVCCGRINRFGSWLQILSIGQGSPIQAASCRHLTPAAEGSRHFLGRHVTITPSPMLAEGCPWFVRRGDWRGGTRRVSQKQIRRFKSRVLGVKGIGWERCTPLKFIWIDPSRYCPHLNGNGQPRQSPCRFSWVFIRATTTHRRWYFQ